MSTGGEGGIKLDICACLVVSVCYVDSTLVWCYLWVSRVKLLALDVNPISVLEPRYRTRLEVSMPTALPLVFNFRLNRSNISFSK